ncbi:MAG: divergent PAP2 family protein [Lachnospiraceae bacterium]|nr:divergent PAP2 family protein [Lachnospiraceae bacterium]
MNEQGREIFFALINNKLLVSALVGWFTAQILKTMINALMTKEFNPERLVGSGGMPSSHSATVCGLTTAAAIVYGLASAEFAISFVLAVIVMYDAMGVRRETGKQAKLLNLMMSTFRHEHKGLPEEILKEYIGHTPLQVLGGAVLGIILAIWICS